MNHYNFFTLKQELEALFFDVGEDLVEIEMLKELSEFEYQGVHIQPVSKGSLVKLPLFIVLSLITNQEAKIVQNDMYSALYNELKKQQESVTLQALSPGFLAYYLSLLVTSPESSITSNIWLDSTQAQKSQETLQNLINERLKKILRELKVVDFRRLDKKLDTVEKPLIQAIKLLLTDFDSVTKYNNLDTA